MKEGVMVHKITHDELVESVGEMAVRQTEYYLELKNDFGVLQRGQLRMQADIDGVKADLAGVKAEVSSVKADMADLRSDMNKRFDEVLSVLREKQGAA